MKQMANNINKNNTDKTSADWQQLSVSLSLDTSYDVAWAMKRSGTAAFTINNTKETNMQKNQSSHTLRTNQPKQSD